MKTIGLIFTIFFLMVYAAIVNGWALVKLWVWFVVPVFNVPALTIPTAIGISMVVEYLTHQHQENSDEDKDIALVIIKGALTATLKPLFALLFGVIVKAWI